MFANQMQIILYVEDVPKSVAFWQSLGFEIIDEQTADGTSIVEIAPSSESDARFVLYDKGFIEAHSPEVALNSPSIMFFGRYHNALQEITRYKCRSWRPDPDGRTNGL